MSLITQQLLLILLLVGINGFFAMSEIALVTIKSSRLESLKKKGNSRPGITKKLVENSSKFLSTIQIGITFAGFLASASTAVILADPIAEVLRNLPIPLVAGQSHKVAVVLTTAFISYITLIFGELVPKQIALRWTERISLLVSVPIRFLGFAAYPLVKFLSFSTNLVMKLLPDTNNGNQQQVTEEEIRQMVNEHKRLQDEEKYMIEGIFEFDDILVKEIMIPRTDIVSICQDATIKEAFEITSETGFSRLPVIGDSLDEIKGIIHVRDLVSHMVEGSKDAGISEVMRSPYYIPESKKALDLLEEFQKQNTHLAIVINEYGGTEGLITMEDLLEEIVGDIQDEHDIEENEITKLNKTHVTIKGDADIQDINDRLNLNIPDLEKYETIAGFILYRLNRIPEPGEKFKFDNTIFTITEMKGQRITQVKITQKNIKKKKRVEI